jgi:hypothetical protein
MALSYVGLSFTLLFFGCRVPHRARRAEVPQADRQGLRKADLGDERHWVLRSDWLRARMSESGLGDTPAVSYWPGIKLLFCPKFVSHMTLNFM